MIWLRLWKATHKLQSIIPDLTLVKQPNIHLLWTTIRDHHIPSTQEEINGKVQEIFTLRQGSGSVADFIAKVRRSNDVLKELKMSQTEEQLKAIISMGLRDTSMDELIATMEGVSFILWCQKLIKFEKCSNIKQRLHTESLTSTTDIEPIALLTHTYDNTQTSTPYRARASTCTICSRPGHTADKCYSNPDYQHYKGPVCV
jgi:hypothetical protein